MLVIGCKSAFRDCTVMRNVKLLPGICHQYFRRRNPLASYKCPQHRLCQLQTMVIQFICLYPQLPPSGNTVIRLWVRSQHIIRKNLFRQAAVMWSSDVAQFCPPGPRARGGSSTPFIWPRAYSACSTVSEPTMEHMATQRSSPLFRLPAGSGISITAPIPRLGIALLRRQHHTSSGLRGKGRASVTDFTQPVNTCRSKIPIAEDR